MSGAVALLGIPTSVLPNEGSHVYVVRAANGLLKLGFTQDLAKRVRALQGLSPDLIECVAFAAGGRREEKALHGLIAPHRHHGEWFSATPEVLVVVASLAKVIEALAAADARGSTAEPKPLPLTITMTSNVVRLPRRNGESRARAEKKQRALVRGVFKEVGIAHHTPIYDLGDGGAGTIDDVALPSNVRRQIENLPAYSYSYEPDRPTRRLSSSNPDDWTETEERELILGRRFLPHESMVNTTDEVDR